MQNPFPPHDEKEQQEVVSNALPRAEMEIMDLSMLRDSKEWTGPVPHQYQFRRKLRPFPHKQTCIMHGGTCKSKPNNNPQTSTGIIAAYSDAPAGGISDHARTGWGRRKPLRPILTGLHKHGLSPRTAATPSHEVDPGCRPGRRRTPGDRISSCLSCHPAPRRGVAAHP